MLHTEKDRPNREKTTLVDQLINIGLDAKSCRLGWVTKPHSQTTQ